MSPIVIIVAIVLVGLVLVIAAVSIRRSNETVVEERLGRYTDFTFLPQVEEPDKATAAAKDKKQESALTRSLDQALEQRKFGQKWRTELARADLRLTVSEFLALHVIAMVGMGFLGYFVLFSGQIVLAILSAGVGIFLPRFYVSYKKSQRLRSFENQLADLLGLWVNSLRSGYSTMQSMEAISREAPAPSAQEFRRVVQEVQLGIPQDKALAHLLERMPSEDLDLVVTAVNIQREVGGNLAEILEVISHTIRERIKLKGEISVLTAQGRITGYLISGLPIVLALFLMAINPNYMGNLFKNRLCGWPMLAIGLGLIGIGSAVIQRIVDIEI
jgi:tight adherence protein B